MRSYHRNTLACNETSAWSKPAEGWGSVQKPQSFVGFSFRPARSSLRWSRTIRSRVQSMYSTARTGCSITWTSTTRNGVGYSLAEYEGLERTQRLTLLAHRPSLMERRNDQRKSDRPTA